MKLAVLVAAAAGAPAIWAATDTATGKPAASSDKMPSSGAAMMKMDPAKVFNMMDPDKKGYVTKEEFMKFQEKLFGTWDKDKNERLSQAEFLGYP
jgi:Ca2+-binding EF-hand superfamily protein